MNDQQLKKKPKNAFPCQTILTTAFKAIIKKAGFAGKGRTGFKAEYLAVINAKPSSARPNSSALPRTASTPLRSRCWLLKGADDDSSRLLGGGCATSAAHEGCEQTERGAAAGTSRAELSQAVPSQAFFRAGAKHSGGVCPFAAPLEHPGRAGSRRLRAPLTPHARSSLTGRRSKFIWPVKSTGTGICSQECSLDPNTSPFHAVHCPSHPLPYNS